jgi:hypothetical protein
MRVLGAVPIESDDPAINAITRTNQGRRSVRTNTTAGALHGEVARMVT